MTRLDIETKFLERLGQRSLVEEGEGGVSESGFKKILVDEDVELVGFENYRHIKKRYWFNIIRRDL